MKRIIKLLVFTLVLAIPSIVFAANLTKDDLVAAAEKYNNICDGDESYIATDETTGTCTPKQTIEVTDTNINITTVGQSQPLTFEYLIDEDGKITFTAHLPIQNGINKGQYKAVTDPGAVNSIPFTLVAVARGAKIGDATLYFGETFSTMAEGVATNCQGLDGEALTNCMATVGPSTGTQYTDEEFPDHVIEIAESEFAQPRILKDDKTDQINSTTITTSFTKTSETQGRVDINTVIDTNADYSKLARQGENPETSTPEPQPQAEEANPGTGAAAPVIVLIGLLIIGIIFAKAYGRRTIHNI